MLQSVTIGVVKAAMCNISERNLLWTLWSINRGKAPNCYTVFFLCFSGKTSNSILFETTITLLPGDAPARLVESWKTQQIYTVNWYIDLWLRISSFTSCSGWRDGGRSGLIADANSIVLECLFLRSSSALWGNFQSFAFNFLEMSVVLSTLKLYSILSQFCSKNKSRLKSRLFFENWSDLKNLVKHLAS